MDKSRYVLTDAIWERIKDIVPGKVGDPGPDRCGQPHFFGSGSVARADRRAMAKPPEGIRKVEQRVPALSEMGGEKGFRSSLRGVVRYFRFGVRFHGCRHC